MGITEELQSLEEMKAKGTLTDDEFAAAKAAAISNYGQSASAQPASKSPEVPQKKPSTSGMGGRLFLLAVVIVGIWFVAQGRVNRPTTEVLKAAARMPVDLTNEVENLPASSWRAVPIQLPYDGSLTISVQVVRGNPIEIFLTDSNTVDQMKSGSSRGSNYGGFYASKATTFQHTERLNQGTYYFVMRDNTLGILSYSASDVSLKAHIEP